jgi:hypothetical protein
MRESHFQSRFLRRIEDEFPECVIIVPDPSSQQGITDRVVLFGTGWVALEFKAHAKAALRPNQAYYVGLLGSMSYAAFVYPENEEEVFCAIQQAFANCWNPRLPQS